VTKNSRNHGNDNPIEISYRHIAAKSWQLFALVKQKSAGVLPDTVGSGRRIGSFLRPASFFIQFCRIAPMLDCGP
jgi:hypothetical protein